MFNSQNAMISIVKVIKQHAPDLSFTMLDVGALPLGEVEPFYWLGEHFPNAKVIGFEVDEELCQKLNATTPPSFTFYAQALGGINGEVPFYIAKEPMCSSLYKPNQELTRYYNKLEVSDLDRETTIQTTTLDTFCHDKGIKQIDFIKIDIQGGELDVFREGVASLASTVMIVSEVEFVPIYENQPLFGDVCSFLIGLDFMFHKFKTLAGRTLKPLVIKNDPNRGIQTLWGDAVFIKDVRKLEALDKEQLLRLAIFSCMYESIDLTFHCLALYDSREGTDLRGEVVNAMQVGQ